MKIVILFFLCCLFMPRAIMAQEPILVFETAFHDFGKIKETDGPVSFRYKFTNRGTSNLIILQVRPGCSCTKVNSITDSVPPGTEGYIDATFNVSHWDGTFNKLIEVYSNTKEQMTTLMFSGTVVPRTKTIADSFPYVVGNLRLRTNYIRFMNLNTNMFDTFQSFNIANTGSKPLTINGINTNSKSYISINDLPITLLPHTKMNYLYITILMM